ncbi:MAG: hypothetical protein QM778_30150 [Myxococcales bacterium]
MSFRALWLSSTVLILLWQAQLVGDWRVDDAYITFAYSKNLALGQGPVFGHDLRVEGYTNFLWMILQAVLNRAHDRALFFLEKRRSGVSLTKRTSRRGFSVD